MPTKKANSDKAAQNKKNTKTDSKNTKKDANLKRHDTDTGSPEVQIALLSDEITMLQGHLQTHPKDFDAKRSLLKKVAKRRTFMKYLKAHNIDAYTSVAKELGLKA